MVRNADLPTLVIGAPDAKAQSTMLPVEEVAQLVGRGFEQVKILPGATYADNSTIVVIPTRGQINYRVVQAWQNLIAPMNQKRAILFAAGHEVGRAYDTMISNILANPTLSQWKYILTLEDDNIPPADAHVRLIESIEYGKYDACSGIYFTKGEYCMPMAYGDPADYKRTGVLDFKPRDVRTALANGNIMPVNGIAMGCALWRLDLFREIPAPWFVTVADVTPGGAVGFTQDLYFCRSAVMAGKKFAVDLRVRVGHLDVNTDTVY